MTRLAWITDPHFDSSGPALRNDLAIECKKKADAVVITGDISTGKRFAHDLNGFMALFEKPIYFVLGNHDYWDTSFRLGDATASGLRNQDSRFHWLDSGEVHRVGGAALCGVGGWYDAYYGDWDRSSIEMNDWNRTRELFEAKILGRASLISLIRKRAMRSAEMALDQLEKTSEHVPLFFATHVPPYPESAVHNGRMSDETALPWYTNKVLGYVLSAFAEKRPGQMITTLCGHSHSRGTFEQAPNHTVLTGAAEYGKPAIERIFDL